MKLALLCAALAAALAAADRSPFAGTWQADSNGQTALELRLRESGSGKFVGSATFFLVSRGPDGKWRTEDKTESDLQNVRLEGNALRFEIPPGHDFRMELEGLQQAVLSKLGDHPPAAPIRLEKRGK